jgi:membrane protease YdiL (CAAX protease family)
MGDGRLGERFASRGRERYDNLMSSLPEKPDASQSFPEAGKDLKPRLWVEICVVLALAALPAFFQALGSFWLPRESSTPFTFIALNYLIGAIQETVPLLYIMRMSGKPWGYFGLTRPRVFLDTVFAAGLFVSLFILMSGLARLFPPDPLSEGQLSIGKASERSLFLILVICFSVAFGEELVCAVIWYRGWRNCSDQAGKVCW